MMMDSNPNQQLNDPSMVFIPPNFIPGNQISVNQPTETKPTRAKSQGLSATLSRIPSLYLYALILLAFSWLLHAIATFIPYWSTYSGISGSRAGLWSARYFDFTTIQNFYFPGPDDFPNITDSIRFTTANTKGYLVTVQFLMTFNFVVMLIVVILLAVDYMVSRRSAEEPRSFLIRSYNTSDTGIKFGLLLFIIYVFGVFEFSAWITYVGSRHDNNWNMHVSFAFAVIVSVFLIVVFGMYVIEFMRTFEKNRMKWQYWYGPYIQWAFFVYLTALLLLLIVICCPEWAYSKNDLLYAFAEIGLFKQCLLSAIYKKSPTTVLCTLSNSKSNQSWVDATQAFVLMAYIIGIILLIILVVFRKEFRHDPKGYYTERVSQPKFTYVMAGLILFFCFIFTLIAVAIFGGKVFPNGLTANWAYIIAIFAMVLFLVAGILFIMDAVHSERQALATDSSENESFFFPAPLNTRVLTMQSTPKPKPPPMSPPSGQIRSSAPPPQPWPTVPPPAQMTRMPPPPTQMMMRPPPPNYPIDEYPTAPLMQAALNSYVQQAKNNPQLLAYPPNQSLVNYSSDYRNNLQNSGRNNNTNNDLIDILRQQAVQQQRLNYNHDRLLERYNRLTNPRVSAFHTFGASSLPGRNYDDYLGGMYGDQRNENSLAAASRAGIGSSDETYQWMGDESDEPLPRSVRAQMQNRRNDPFPRVSAEHFGPVKMYHHSIFGLMPAYIRLILQKTNHLKKVSDESEQEMQSNNSDTKAEGAGELSIVTANDNQNGISDHAPWEYVSYTNWKTKHENSMPLNPLLFNIYTHRSNGSVHSYGQSLYVPSIYPRNRLTESPSDIDSGVADVPLEFSSPLSDQHHKLHHQSSLKTILYGPVESISAGLSVPSSLNLIDTPDVLSKPMNSESVATSTSVLPHQTLSSVNNKYPVVALFSDPRATSPTQRNAISSEIVPTGVLVSHAKLTRINIKDEDDHEKQCGRQKTTKLAAATTDSTSVDSYSSSSDD